MPKKCLSCGLTNTLDLNYREPGLGLLIGWAKKVEQNPGCQLVCQLWQPRSQYGCNQCFTCGTLDLNYRELGSGRLLIGWPRRLREPWMSISVPPVVAWISIWISISVPPVVPQISIIESLGKSVYHVALPIPWISIIESLGQAYQQAKLRRLSGTLDVKTMSLLWPYQYLGSQLQRAWVRPTNRLGKKVEWSLGCQLVCHLWQPGSQCGCQLMFHMWYLDLNYREPGSGPPIGSTKKVEQRA